MTETTNTPDKNFAEVVRNFTFGVEDSLVSTVGLLAGVAAAGMPKQSVILTGVVLIFVEAFSMGVGSLISEHSVEEYEANDEVPLSKSLGSSAVMFFSYLFAGIIPLLPYFLLSNPKQALLWSIGASLVSLFALGFFNAKMFHIKAFKQGWQTLVMGGIAVLVGVGIGQLVPAF